MANRLKLKRLLIENAAVTGPVVTLQQGGMYTFNCIAAAWAGATVKLQILGPDDVTYVDVPTASHTVNGVIGVYLPAGGTVKAVVTGGPPTAVYASLALVD